MQHFYNSLMQLDGTCKEQENKSSLKELLENYYKFHGVRDLAKLFENYMQGIGARKLDCRKKDTANTYKIARSSTDGNQVECYYYKNSGTWRDYGKFAFRITLRKEKENCFLIDIGSTDAEIKRLYEISYGTVLCYEKEQLLKLVRQHPELFVMLCGEEK